MGLLNRDRTEGRRAERGDRAGEREHTGRDDRDDAGDLAGDRPPGDRDATTVAETTTTATDRTRVVDRGSESGAEVVEERRHEGFGAEEETIPTLVRERSWTVAPGQLVSMVAGGALVIVGTLALVRAGLSEPLSTPVVQVIGLDHTAWLGLGEIALGLLLMLVGSGAWGRPISVMLGALMVVAGVLVLAEAGAMPDELALERDHGWLLIPLGALVAVAAMALPVWRNTHTNVRALDLQGHDDRTRGRRFRRRR